MDYSLECQNEVAGVVEPAVWIVNNPTPLVISQKSAWCFARRIRETWDRDDGVFGRPVEIDETFTGGNRRNMSNAKRKELAGTGRGTSGKTEVIGVKYRSSNQVVAQPVESVKKGTVNEMLGETLDPDACAYADDSAAFEDLAHRELVNHSVSELVRGMAHTIGIEPISSMLKRGYQGTPHKMSAKLFARYVNEFSGRHNMRTADALAQLILTMRRMTGRRLRRLGYRDLVRGNGLNSGARAMAA